MAVESPAPHSTLLAKRRLPALGMMLSGSQVAPVTEPKCKQKKYDNFPATHTAPERPIQLKFGSCENKDPESRHNTVRSSQAGFYSWPCTSYLIHPFQVKQAL